MALTMKKKKPDLNAQLVAAMREDSNKWNVIVKILEQEKQGIEANIFAKKDDDGKELTAKQIYDLVTWHQFLAYVSGLPELILGDAAPKPRQEEPDFDVYDTPLTKVRKTIERDAD